MRLYLVRTLLILNIGVVLGLWITGFLSGLNPERWGWFSLVGYAFPFFIIATMLFIFVWMFICKRCTFVSIIGILVAYYPVTLYCPVNFLQPSETLFQSSARPSTDGAQESSETITVMNYNVLSWGRGYIDNDVVEEDFTDEEKELKMSDYFRSVDADIVTIEEGVLTGKLDSLRSIYHYTDTLLSCKSHGPVVQILSKYHITRKENFNFPNSDNGGGAFWINFKGHEIIVVALHLQTMGLSVHEKERFNTMVHEKDSVKSTSKTIFSKILQASKKRVHQADIVARFIEGHQGCPMIVMGDFNDIPQSYTYARICDQLLDCYRETGFGPGYSFKHFSMHVRIDNILCSKDFTPLSCDVDKNIKISDHQPIIATLKLSR